MSSHTLLFLVGVFVAGSFALYSSRWNSWWTLFTGSAITILGAAWGFDLLQLGLHFKRPEAAGLGQIYMVFSSVLGGALISSGFSELRAKFRAKGGGKDV